MANKRLLELFVGRVVFGYQESITCIALFDCAVSYLLLQLEFVKTSFHAKKHCLCMSMHIYAKYGISDINSTPSMRQATGR